MTDESTLEIGVKLLTEDHNSIPVVALQLLKTVAKLAFDLRCNGMFPTTSQIILHSAALLAMKKYKVSITNDFDENHERENHKNCKIHENIKIQDLKSEQKSELVSTNFSRLTAPSSNPFNHIQTVIQSYFSWIFS